VGGIAPGSWELPDELVLLQDNVRRFMRKEVRPIEDRLPHDAFAIPQADLLPLQQKARALGLWCVASPSEHGGGGLSLLAQAVVAEEAARCKMGAYVPACGAFGIDPPSVIWSGTKHQIEKYGVSAMRHGKKCFVAITEASGGSDPARSIRTRAVVDGSEYVINGSKMFITAAKDAEWGILFARTGAQEDRKGISAFIVDGQVPGLTMKPVPVIYSYGPYELHFKDVRIPKENLLGAEGEGFKICEKWLVHIRIPYAATVIGVAQEAMEMAIAWAKQRTTFKTRLADKQAIQWMLADSEMELRAARLLTYQAAWQGDLGHDFKLEASIAKVVATETAGRVLDRCVQIFGGLGVSKELPLERWFRELRFKRIGEGPSEVHRMVVARHLLGGPSKGA
jgi:acyl-CoA dehydrogenase